MAGITKEKIAISLDKPLVTMVDAMVDGTTYRSRSQAIEHLVRKGLAQEYVQDAVILIKKDHQRLLLEDVQGKPLLLQHLLLLEKASVQRCFLVTEKSNYTDDFIAAVQGKTNIAFEIVYEEKQKGNVAALELLRHKLSTNFVVILGDTYNNFDLKKMILFHLSKNKIATVGLMTHKEPSLYSSVQLEGDRIVEFRNRKKSDSYVIDAGIYVFNLMLFEYFTTKARFFEKDVLPQLCSLDHINGYFTYGKYVHFGE
jgi:NDP-sugar pyrophosphorylase family protein